MPMKTSEGSQDGGKENLRHPVLDLEGRKSYRGKNFGSYPAEEAGTESPPKERKTATQKTNQQVLISRKNQNWGGT